MTNMNDDNEYDPTLNELFNDIQDIVNKITQQAEQNRIRFEKCEKILEQLVAEDKVDLLTDPNGFFHYRLTEAGKDLLRADGCAIDFSGEFYVNPWRLA